MYKVAHKVNGQSYDEEFCKNYHKKWETGIAMAGHVSVQCSELWIITVDLLYDRSSSMNWWF